MADEVFWDPKTELYVTGTVSYGDISPDYAPGKERNVHVHLLNEIRSLTTVLTKLLESLQAKP